MGILDKLRPQPEWRHTDPAVRVAAVEQLAEEEAGEVLNAIAQDDTDARVRLAAVERLTDLPTLITIAHDDANDEVRRAASAVLRDVACDTDDESVGRSALDGVAEPRDLVEIAKTAALEPVGLAAVARLAEPKGLAQVTRRGCHAAVRLEAFRRIDDPAEMTSIALKSEHRDVAMAALGRVGGDEVFDREAIEAIAARAKSKVVARRAKAMLRARDGLPQAPSAEALRDRRMDLCRRVEALAASDAWNTLHDEQREIQASWDELTADAAEPDPADAELVDRFASAAGALHRRLEAHRQEQDEQARRRAAQAAATAARVACCERIERASAEDAMRETELVRAEWTAWPADEGLDPADLGALQQRFGDACAAAERRHHAWQEVQAWRERVGRVIQEFEELVGAGEIADVGKRWSAARGDWPALEAGWTDELRERIRGIESRLKARRAELREADERQRRANLARLTQRCDQLEALARSDTLTLKQAERGFRDARLVFERRERLPTTRDRDAVQARLKAIQKAFYPRLHELREIESWQQWANVSIQEELCRRVEALQDVEELAEVARQLRECLRRWKAAATVPQERAAALWQRFKAGHDGAYARCAEFYAQQSRAREENLQRKAALCASAEALKASTEWLKTAGQIVELQKEWKTIGPVPRRHAKAVWRRFRAACDEFFSRRKADLAQRKELWVKNLERKEALCAQAETLAESCDWVTASAELKRLQVEWKSIGPVKRSRSDAIWQRFRAAGQRFAERFAQRDEIELAATVAAREALCAELEALVPSGEAGEASPPAGLAEQVDAIRDRWRQAGALPQRRAQPLTFRYHGAIARLVEAFPDGFKGTDLDPQKNRRRMEQLCERVERLLASTVEESVAGLSPAELLARTWRDTLATNTMGAREDTAARQRAAVDEVKQVQADWKRLGPMPGETGRALAKRFQGACDRFFAERSKQHPRGHAG